MITLTFDLDPEEIPESPRWKCQMTQLGATMANNNVRRIFFAHGTFAGDDPLGINSLIGNLERARGIQLFKTETLRKFTKHAFDNLVKDSGNFTVDYINSFGAAIQNDICCKPFVWSSGNNHMARLIGAVKLCNNLAEVSKSYRGNDRILLIGHSHAGQVFALLTTLLENSEKAAELMTIINKSSDLDASIFDQNLTTIRKIKLDIVTFGTPIRYRWGKNENYRLISVINDRGNNVDIDGLLYTRDGDYIQQWGTEGTDLPQKNFSDLNKELDNILLNKGHFSPSELKDEFIRKLEDKNRKEPLDYDGSNVTETYLVNYQDQGDSSLFERFLEFNGVPHCIKTLFGHGIYTRKKTMLLNTKHIVNNLY